MNTQRIIVLGLALVAAGGAAFLVRGMLGGGTPQVEAKPQPVIAMSEVLVANSNLTPGQALSPDLVRWEKWPAATVDQAFITHQAAGSIEAAVKGTVVRAPVLQGQPITTTAVVRGEASGFMAASLGEGMRAVSITISPEAGAGGFVLPNDRVDVILTRRPEGQSRTAYAKTIITNLRVLAVDQTFKQEKDTRTVIGKTATVEVTPEQAEMIAGAAVTGQLSLALRPIASATAPNANDVSPKPRSGTADGPVSVIRYGMAAGTRPGESSQ